MIEKRLAWVLLLISQFTFSQIKGVVVDENDKPIPYVNIWVENENIGTTSQEDGTFVLNDSEVNKNLIFSAIGYKKTTTLFKNKIILEREYYKLDEVTISSIKNTKEIEIGGFTKTHHTQLSGDKPWIYAKSFYNEPNYSETPFIKKIIFYSDSEIKGAKLKIRIFEMNDSLPKDDLLTEDLIFTVKKGLEKNVIDVSSFKIKFPKNGLAVGLEWMIIDENKYVYKYKDKEKGLQEMVCYSPSLIVNYSEIENSYRYSGGKWFKNKIFHTDKNDKPWYNKAMVPAINLILTN